MDKTWIIVGTCIVSTLAFITLVICRPDRAGNWLSLYGTCLISLGVYVS